MDFLTTGVAELAGLVRSGKVGARELVELALERIETLNPALNAFVALDPEASLVEAARVDEIVATGGDPGPLAGIPLGVKDLEDAAGFPTSFGSALNAGAPPARRDSAMVARLRAAGCVVVGKTNTPEYGHKGTTDNPLFGTTRNPWNTAYTPGGSSGGSAAALAAGMVPLATGSDGGGSIRIPSALCGLSGIKTTQGWVPVGGTRPPGSGVLTVVGPMARRIEDVALALEVCSGPDPTDIFSFPASLNGLAAEAAVASAERRLPSRVGWSPGLGYGRLDRTVERQTLGFIDRLAAAGVEIVEIPDVFDHDPVAEWFPYWAALRYRTQGHLIGTVEWELVDPSLRFQIEYGRDNVSARDVVAALDAAHMLNLRLEEVLTEAGVEQLLTPVAAGVPPLIGAEGTIDGEQTPGWVQFTYPFNLSRNPVGTVPVGWLEGTSPDEGETVIDGSPGVPLGVQVVGRQRGDAGVVAVVAALETLDER